MKNKIAEIIGEYDSNIEIEERKGNMKSTRIKRIKTLQHLALKCSGCINLRYAAGEWFGTFEGGSTGKIIESHANTFREMLEILHIKVRCELTALLTK